MTETAVSNDQQGGSARKVGAALGIGILILPFIFAWFLLRKGYSNTARVIAFGWLVVVFLFAISGSGGSGQAAGGNSTVATAAEQAVASEPVSKLTRPQQNAVRTAQQYLNMTGFSRDGLIHQLSSNAGDGYDIADATAAVDSLNVDWNENAAKSAKQYLSMSGFSCSGLINQLSSSAGDKYTVEQATFGAREAGACS